MEATIGMAIGGGLGSSGHCQYGNGQWLTHKLSSATTGMAMGGGRQ